MVAARVGFQRPSAGAFAPASIQARSFATCAAVRAWPSGGIRVSSVAVTRAMSSLSAAFPGTTAPAAVMAAAVSRRSFAFCWRTPWQA